MRAVYAIAIPNAQRIADPFHVVKQANERLDLIRRRVQWQTLGHRGRKTDPLYTIRRHLLTGEEKLSAPTMQRVHDALRLGDPNGEIMLAWRVKETIRDLYRNTNRDTAITQFKEVIKTCSKKRPRHQNSNP